MKKFIETLKNIWKVEDLRHRILITILFTAIYRFGSFVVLPGIDPGKLENLQQQTAGGLMSLLDMFSEGGNPVDVGLISEAGLPAVADPGAQLVSLCHRHGIQVVPLVGPSSIILSVMASGFNGQSFAFHGYLPIDEGQRTQRLKQLEARVYAEDQTQLFIETPYRNLKMMQTLLQVLRPSTRISLAADITCPDESIHTRTVNEWKRLLGAARTDEERQRLVPRCPAIFLIYK